MTCWKPKLRRKPAAWPHRILPAPLQLLPITHGLALKEIKAMDKTSLSPSTDHLEWPFFSESHKAIHAQLHSFATSGALDHVNHEDTDNSCRKLVRQLGEAGLLAIATGNAGKAEIDSRAVCLARETLAWHDGL